MFQEIMTNQTLGAVFLLLALMAVEFMKCKNLQYFNFTEKKFQFHYLITKYKLDHRQGEVDEAGLNWQVFGGVLLAGLTAAVIFVFTNIFVSFAVYIVLKDVFRRMIFRRVGLKYGV